MADTFTKAKRSEIMAAIRESGNRSTELKLLEILRRERIAGWRRNVKVRGKPDFVFASRKVALFVDGCFWHGCPLHLRLPSSNRSFWLRKITRNQTRDRETTRELRRRGWHVVRVWEHSLREPRRVANRIRHALA